MNQKLFKKVKKAIRTAHPKMDYRNYRTVTRKKTVYIGDKSFVVAKPQTVLVDHCLRKKYQDAKRIYKIARGKV